MKSIKFRAWDVDSGYMIDSNTSVANIVKKHILDFTGYSFNGEGGDYPNGRSSNESYVLMQYTGLKDKNGQQIFEGDILEFNGKGYYANVIWLEETGCWGTSSGNPLGRAAAMSDRVGNIYENPELMETPNGN